jgi:Mrp family chromosome partitioning ATPase
MAPWIAQMVGDLPTLLSVRETESEEAAIARRRREAGRAWEAALPITYQWARLDHPLLPSRVKLERLPTKPPTDRRVVFFGDAGVGKTTLAVALLRALAESAITTTTFDRDEDVRAMVPRFYFASAHRLGTAGVAVHGDPDAIRTAMRARVLLLDDLGSERSIPSNPIPDVIAERHAEDRVTWVTTGLSAKEIVDRYGGGVARRVLEGAALTRVGS